MILAFIFGLVLFSIVAWNAVVAWYLRRYVLEDDHVHRAMFRMFLAGNVFFLISAIVLFTQTPWREFSSDVFIGDIRERFEGFL